MTDLLYFAADVTAFLGKLSALLILGGILTIVATVLVHAATTGLTPTEQARRARRVIDESRSGFLPCPDCGATDCDCGPVALREAAWLEEGRR